MVSRLSPDKGHEDLIVAFSKLSPEYKKKMTIIIVGEDENGQKLFIEADKPSLRREIPLAVILELMTKMQEVSEEATPDAVNSTT